MRYRVNLPIMVLAFRDNHKVALHVSPGEIFEVVGRAEDNRFLVAEVRGERLLVFECDLEDRGQILPNRKARKVALAAGGEAREQDLAGTPDSSQQHTA